MSAESIEEKMEEYRKDLENSNSIFGGNNVLCTISVKKTKGLRKVLQDLQLLPPDVVNIQFAEPYKKLIDENDDELSW